MNATKTDYTGYRIVTGFLDGNLGDLESFADEYAAACEDALAEAFPGAEIEIRRQRNASGTPPRTMETAVYPPDDSDYFDEGAAAERVDRICGSVWDKSDEWATDAE